MDTSRTQGWMPAVTLAVAYLVVGALSRGLSPGATETVPVWLAAGVLMGALVVAPAGRWSVLLLGAGVAVVAWGVSGHRLGAVPALLFAGIEVGSAAAGAWVARRAGDAGRAVPRATWLVAGALLAAALGATLAAEFWRWQRPGTVWGAEWRTWAFSTVVGMLLVVPVLTAFQGFRIKRSGGMPMRQFAVGALAFAAFAVLAVVVFGGDVRERFGSTAATLAYLPMPLLLLAALLWGARGGALAVLAGGVGVVALTAAGGGPFAVQEGFAGEAVVEVQAYVAVWAALVLFARALVDDRRAALEGAQEWRLRYERALAATRLASVEFDAVTGRATWGDGAAAVLGAAVGQIAHVDDWLARIDASDRALALAAWEAVRQGRAPASADAYTVQLGGRVLGVQCQLAPVHGPDGAVEQVAGLLRVAPATVDAHG